MPEGFFEFRERVNRPTAPVEAKPDPTATLTVAQLTAQIDGAIQTGIPGTIHVRGEMTNRSLHRGSGHLYFTLKDTGACIDCVMFKNAADRMKFEPADGMDLLATGSVKVFAQRGRYQLYVNSLKPLGQGALELAFQQMRAKLESEGLFAATRKKRLPKYPTRLVLITSRETAALQDMLKVLRRFPWVQPTLFHVPVQGPAAAPAIADGLRYINASIASLGGASAILLARGGGSLEDLWAFNEEVVARAIADSVLPVISGIGHEVDVSIADLVADYHAHTPTEAARVAIAAWEKVVDTLIEGRSRLNVLANGLVQRNRERLDAIARHEPFRRPTDRIHRLHQRLDDRGRALSIAVARRTAATRRRLDAIAQQLDRHRPAALLARYRAELARRESRLRSAEQRRLRFFFERLVKAQARLAARQPTAIVSLNRVRLDQLARRLNTAMSTQAQSQQNVLTSTLARLARALQLRQLRSGDQLTRSADRLAVAGPGIVARAQTKLDTLARHLQAVGPDQVLARGYSITFGNDGRVVRSVEDVQPGDHLRTRVPDGEIDSTVSGDKSLFE